jgi:hypothetical protein
MPYMNSVRVVWGDGAPRRKVMRERSPYKIIHIRQETWHKSYT